MPGTVAWKVAEALPPGAAVPRLREVVPGVRPSNVSFTVIPVAAVAADELFTVVLIVICWFGSTDEGWLCDAETTAGCGKTPAQSPLTPAIVPNPGCPGTAP